MRAAVLGTLVAVVLLALGALLAPSPAWAHATLLSTTPTDGGHLDRGPTEVVFTLDEPVSVVEDSAQVVDQDGTRFPVAGAELGAGGAVVTVRLVDPLPDGSFLATARLLSIDTHVVSVSAAFTVGEGAGLLAAPDPEVVGTGDRVASFVAKVAVYLGAVGSAGALLSTAWLWPALRHRRRWRVLVRGGSALLAAGLVTRLVLEAGNRAGGLGRVSGTTLGGLFTVNGAFAVSTVVALVLLLLPFPRAGTVARTRAVAGLTGAATVTAVAYGGHGAEPALFPLPLLLTVLHVYAVVAWLGGVAVVAVVLRGAVPLAAWHRYALVHVALAAVSGVGLALLRVPAPAALVDTGYGIALLAKTALVVLTVVAAGAAYRRLAQGGAGRLRVLGVEALLALTVFGATGVLSSSVPATVAYDPAVRTTVDFGAGAVLDVTIPSTRRGPQEIVVESGTAPAGADPPLSVDLSSADANIARLRVRLDDAPTDRGVRWSSRELVVPVAGSWRVTLTHDTPAGPRVASFSYDVR